MPTGSPTVTGGASSSGGVTAPTPPSPGCYSFYSANNTSWSTLVQLTDADFQYIPVQQYPAPPMLGHDLMWFDDRWFICDVHLSWADPVSGTVTVSDYPCYAGFVYDGELWVLPNVPAARWWRYSTAADAMTHQNYVATDKPNWPHFTRATVSGRILYASHHSTDRVWPIDLGTDAQLPDLVLQGFDSWIMGLSVVDGTLRVLDDGRQEGAEYVIYVRDFDLTTGEELRRVALGYFVPDKFQGLWCVE